MKSPPSTSTDLNRYGALPGIRTGTIDARSTVGKSGAPK